MARGRGLDAAVVVATEARCLTAGEAVKTGFADEVASPDAAFAAFQEFLAGGAAGTGAMGATTREERSKPMSLKDRAALKAAEKEKKTPKAAEDEPKDDPETDPEDDPKAEDGESDDEDEDEKDAGKKAAAVKRRIAAILNATEAKGRDGLARHLALETDLSVEDAIKALAASPKGAGLDAAMAAVGSTPLGSGAPSAESGESWKASVDRVCGKK